MYNVKNEIRGEAVRIGIFGGSFDPVHNEHVRLVEAAIKTLALDKLFVLPAHTPPHKQGKRISDDEARLQMCRLAFSAVPNVEVSDYEISQGGTSYTYLTCRHFQKLYPQAKLYFLVGTDMLRDFPTWKNPEEILSVATLAVCARNERDGWWKEEKDSFYERFHKDFAVIDYNGAPVSSTEIRVRAAAKLPLSAFVDKSVEEYVYANRLYEIRGASEALALQKPTRAAHSVRVAITAAKRAVSLGIDEEKVLTAALFHDCAKNLATDSPLLRGFALQEDWGEVPLPVLHQFTGAYVGETAFGITDEDVLNAIRYHTSGKEEMTPLGALIFLADMVEEERIYDGVDVLRRLYWKETTKGESQKNLFACLLEALRRTIEYLEEKGEIVYPLTKRAYAYYLAKSKGEDYGKDCGNK
ncbi:MAG: nicotinate (nicotinamide) nucleotide adenylyltransferase [Clostridiales bacterium]|nr:nicotinate (nicotinamide) nucleotide adenylyltransferase [Clostridiales bacterium]